MKKKKSEQEEVDDIAAAINKKFGDGTVINLSDYKQEYEGVPTPSTLLNEAIGGKGFPRGRIIELIGAESSSKTTMALQTIGLAQSRGERCAYIDAEHALDLAWATKLGVNLSTLSFNQPGWGEQALQIAEAFIKSKRYSIVVVDSVAALTPKVELEGDAGDQHVGLQARMMGQAMRRLTGVISESKTCVIFINQMRDTIGKFGYGPKTTTPGGRALKFYASVRVELSRISTIKKGTLASGIEVKAKVIKNKMAAPFKEVHYNLMYDRGIVDPDKKA
jgi:recombination protein RecA